MAPWTDVRAVVFDLDGTLIDSAADLRSAVNAMLQRLAPGAEPLDLATVRSFIGDGARTLVARSLAARGLREPLEAGLAAFLEAYRERMLDTTRLYPGVRELLLALRPARALAVLSNKPGGMSRAILAGLGAADCFVRVLGGDDVPRKPDPAGLLGLLGELGVAPSRAAMVGDSANDVLTGRAAGARTVAVTYGFDPEGARSARPEALIAAPLELAGLLGAGGAQPRM